MQKLNEKKILGTVPKKLQLVETFWDCPEFSRNKQKGITLIALIITIIVMLILVGVTVNVALNGGLFSKAEEATSLTQIEAEKEELLSAVMGAIGNDGKVNLPYLDKNLPTGWSGTNGTYTSPKGNTYTVDEYGKIAYTGENSGGGNTPVAFNWETVGLKNIDTTTEYIDDEYGYYSLIFSSEGILRVSEDGVIIAEVDATNSDNIDDDSGNLSFEAERYGELTGFIVSMNSNDIELSYYAIEGSSNRTYTCKKVEIDNKNIYSNEEVLKMLGISNSTGTYKGTWTVLKEDADGKPTKLVSTSAVTHCTLGEDNNLEKSISDYKSAVSILNTSAQQATGISVARSVEIQDIYDIIGEENIDKGTEYNKPYTYNYTNHKDQLFVNESGATVKIDSEGDEVTLTNTYYYYYLTDDQRAQIGVLASGNCWLASPCVRCGSNYAYFDVRYLSDGSISYNDLFCSYGSAYNYGHGYGVRAVVSI